MREEGEDGHCSPIVIIQAQSVRNRGRGGFLDSGLGLSLCPPVEYYFPSIHRSSGRPAAGNGPSVLQGRSVFVSQSQNNQNVLHTNPKI